MSWKRTQNKSRPSKDGVEKKMSLRRANVVSKIPKLMCCFPDHRPIGKEICSLFEMIGISPPNWKNASVALEVFTWPLCWNVSFVLCFMQGLNITHKADRYVNSWFTLEVRWNFHSNYQIKLEFLMKSCIFTIRFHHTLCQWVRFKSASFKTASVVRAGIVWTSASKELVAKELVSKSLMLWKS